MTCGINAIPSNFQEAFGEGFVLITNKSIIKSVWTYTEPSIAITTIIVIEQTSRTHNISFKTCSMMLQES